MKYFIILCFLFKITIQSGQYSSVNLESPIISNSLSQITTFLIDSFLKLGIINNSSKFESYSSIKIQYVEGLNWKLFPIFIEKEIVKTIETIIYQKITNELELKHINVHLNYEKVDNFTEQFDESINFMEEIIDFAVRTLPLTIDLENRKFISNRMFKKYNTETKTQYLLKLEYENLKFDFFGYIVIIDFNIETKIMKIFNYEKQEILKKINSIDQSFFIKNKKIDLKNMDDSAKKALDFMKNELLKQNIYNFINVQEAYYSIINGIKYRFTVILNDVKIFEVFVLLNLNNEEFSNYEFLGMKEIEKI